MFSTMEYNNNLCSPNNEYGSTKGYSNYNTLFAQKLPPTVPSMKYPTILEQSNVYGYDALTHDGDGAGYYNVNTAYGNSCNPSYFVAKCPNNKFIRPFLPGPKEFVSPSACPVENEPISEGFVEGYSTDLLSAIEKLKIIFFYDSKCPHSKNLYQSFVNAVGVDQFHKAVELKNIVENQNEQEMTNLGGYAIPFLYSRTTNNSLTGYVPVQKAIEELSLSKTNSKDTVSISAPSDSLHDKIKQLHLSVYVMKGCYFCDRVKQLLESHKNHIQFKDGLDSKYKDEVKSAQGFPYIVSEKTKKSYTGLPPSLEKLVQSLSH